MKKIIFLLLLSLIWGQTFAQVNDQSYVHTATADNISGHITYLDHPLLNGNSNAQIVVSHNWNPLNSSGVYNPNITSVWYSGSLWAIYNENTALPMEVGSSYNVYIQGTTSHVITHIATLANQGDFDSYTVIDDPMINGNPNPFLVMANSYTPTGVYNQHNYGFFYQSSISRWIIFSEDLATIPEDAGFNVIVQPYDQDATIVFRHASDAGNIAGNYTIIDHALLNGKPDAAFFFSHYWGAPGYPLSSVFSDKVLGAWYTGSQWAIYTEDQSVMPENLVFNIVVPRLAAPLNDACATASEVPSIPYSTTHSASSATNNGGFITTCPSGMNDGVWYKLYVVNAGTVTIDVAPDATWDPEIAVYTGSCGSLSCVDNVDDGLGDGLPETLTFNAAAGTEYIVNIGSYQFSTDDVEGVFDLAITGSAVLNTESNDIAGFILYPNPVEDTLFIDAEDVIESIRINNLLGQEVIRYSTDNNKVIDVSQLKSGTYIINVMGANKIGTYKFIKI